LLVYLLNQIFCKSLLFVLLTFLQKGPGPVKPERSDQGRVKTGELVLEYQGDVEKDNALTVCCSA
jgi:hypothetical protein